MDKDQARQEIRSRISCIPYLKKSKNGLYCCPLCGSGNGPNGTGAVKFYAETNTWYCNACRNEQLQGKQGDIITLYREQTGASYPDALQALAAQIGISIDEFGPAPRTGPTGGAQGREPSRGSAKAPAASSGPQTGAEAPTEPTADYTTYYQICAQRVTDPAAVAYLNRRGISIATAQAHGIGFDPAADPAGAPGATGNERKPHPCPRIIIPCSKAHYIGRSIDPATPKAFGKLNPTGSKPAIFNGSAVYAQEAREVFITEGAFDALSLLEAGYPAIGLNSAANADEFCRHLEQRRPTATALLLCLDNDKRGQAATEKIEAAAERLQIPAVDVRHMVSGKDPNEALTADPAAFRAAMAEARRGALEVIKARQEAARQAEREQQQRTGAGMVESFLSAIRTRKYEPIPTGISDLDRALGGGLMRQWLVLLGAPPGAGKTALAQWLFEGMAERGTTCLFVNLEMSREQLMARSISRIAARKKEKITPVEVLQGYKWNAAQEAIALTAAEEYKRDIAPNLIYNPNGESSDLDEILKYIEDEAARAEAAGLPAPVLVIDYLQVITSSRREEKTDLIQRAIGRLKGYAIDHDTVCFAIMAQNRAANKTGVSTMESGRDTSGLEYAADLLMGLDFTKCLPRNGGKSVDELTAEDKHCKTLVVHKSRFAEPGKCVDLYFNGESMSFDQLAPERSGPDLPHRQDNPIVI